MEINRDYYLNQVIDAKHNGLIKIITGICRCGKSYLLNKLFYQHLIDEGVKESHIIKVALDSIENKNLRDALKLYEYVKEKFVEQKMFKNYINFINYFYRNFFYSSNNKVLFFNVRQGL